MSNLEWGRKATRRRLVRAEKLLLLVLRSGHVRDVGPSVLWPRDLDAKSRVKVALALIRDSIKIQDVPDNESRLV